MMVNRRVPLRQDLLQIAVGEGISQIPNAPEDDHVFECRPWDSAGRLRGYALPDHLDLRLQQKMRPGGISRTRALPYKNARFHGLMLPHPVVFVRLDPCRP